MKTQNRKTTQNIEESKKMSAHKAKRQALKDLSAQAAELQATIYPDKKINEILILKFYTDQTHREFKTLADWNKEGQSVRKGETAFLIWGKKKPLHQSEQEAQSAEDGEEAEFFPLCYLFSNAQVQPRNAKK